MSLKFGEPTTRHRCIGRENAYTESPAREDARNQGADGRLAEPDVIGK